MKYCVNCGKELSDDARFCDSCGTPVVAQTSKKRVEHAGTVYKCPNCGEVLGGFVAICPGCGYEIRNVKSSGSVQSFADQLASLEAEEMPANENNSIIKKIFGRDLRETPKRLEEARREFDEQKRTRKINLITNFPVPNTKEDIMEFVLLIRSNLQDTSNDNIYFAWAAKLEQLYQKARIMLPSDPITDDIRTLYFQSKRKVRLKKMSPFYLLGSSFALLLLMCGFTYAPGLTIAIIAVLGVCIIAFLFYNRKERI